MVTDVIGRVVLIVVLYLAFRIGAALLKVLLGLSALCSIVWPGKGLVGGVPSA